MANKIYDEHIDLGRANFSKVNLSMANIRGEILDMANLSGAILIKTNMGRATLTGCKICGISAWDLELEDAKQNDLVITPSGQLE